MHGSSTIILVSKLHKRVERHVVLQSAPSGYFLFCAVTKAEGLALSIHVAFRKKNQNRKEELLKELHITVGIIYVQVL